MKEGYIKRATSTIPFGYELVDESSSFLKPIEEELEALQIAENMVVNEEVSLQARVSSSREQHHKVIALCVSKLKFNESRPTGPKSFTNMDIKCPAVMQMP